MALPTATRSIICGNCRQSILRSFISSIGGPSIRAPPSPRRAFSTPTRRWNEARERIQLGEREEHALNDINDEFTSPQARPANTETLQEARDDNEEQASPETAHVPWYLQVEPQIQPQENAFSARQRIPELPDHPPPILQPLLERISVELGMDDLSVLDLRAINPPPALGANLLMIVGTARSEKHLHFSADKLCRWLRTEHRLTPYADGLLGRQELKLKLRRRAKRSRLLSAVGTKSTADTELEDGIRTGWICVNIGTVEGGELPKTEQQLEREKNIVGFGSSTTGSNIVVQLLTEDKRGELELERVWAAVLKQSRREKAELERVEDISQEAKITTEHPPKAPSETERGPDISKGRSEQTAFHPFHTTPAQQQIRAYHKSARKMQASPLLEQTVSDITSKFRDGVPADPNQMADTDGSLSTLNSLLSTLKQMPPDRASTASTSKPTASDISDEISTSSELTQAFHNAMPTFPGPHHWHVHIELLCQRGQHHSYDQHILLESLFQMQLAGIVPLEKTYIMVLTNIARNISQSADYERALTSVFDILEEMETHGYDALCPQVLELLHGGLLGPLKDPSTYTVQSLSSALGLARLQRQLDLQDIKGFWQTWRGFPMRFTARSADMYVTLFDALAEGKLPMSFHDKRETISENLVSMEIEQPPVVPEHEGVELAMSIFKALRLADPEGVYHEWDKMRDRCEKILRAALTG